MYFRADATLQFGYESGYDRDTMLRLFAERGGDPDRPGKSDELDALMWRAERPGEPSWPSPFGPGRPGWHVECSAIALSRIGTGLDIQGGGSDLIFPHHEFSAAHAESVTGERRFARHYVHAGMIGWDGHKMSKSRGNLVLVSRLRADGVEPAAIRLGLLAGHYRADRSWSDEVLDEAIARPAPVADRDCAAGGHPTPPTWWRGCASTWPTTSIPRKRLPHWMVGRPTHWSTAATTPRRRRLWRPRSTRCSASSCRTARPAPPGVDWSTFRAMGSVNGKVVLITGGANGIGAEVARRLHAKGAKLVLTDLDEGRLKEVAAATRRGPGAHGRRRRARPVRPCKPPSTRASSGSAASTS